MKYRGYEGSIRYEIDAVYYYGRITNVEGLVHYSSPTRLGLEAAFRQAVDDYIKFLEEESNVHSS